MIITTEQKLGISIREIFQGYRCDMTIKNQKKVSSFVLSPVEVMAMGSQDICDESSLYKRNRSHGVRTNLLTIKMRLSLIYK